MGEIRETAEIDGASGVDGPDGPDGPDGTDGKRGVWPKSIGGTVTAADAARGVRNES
ncbi:hypothetical protein GCM10027160_11240 [Streptomyces calidiresistens]